MSVKRSQKEKQLRRELEILRSQIKVGNIGKASTEKTDKKDKFELPLKSIKKDLTKTTFFALISISTLIAMSYFKVGQYFKF